MQELQYLEQRQSDSGKETKTRMGKDPENMLQLGFLLSDGIWHNLCANTFLQYLNFHLTLEAVLAPSPGPLTIHTCMVGSIGPAQLADGDGSKCCSGVLRDFLWEVEAVNFGDFCIITTSNYITFP